ncbi:MAG: TonB-dependent receptor plug domain-containing protein [Planctomycetota bacterium]
MLWTQRDLAAQRPHDRPPVDDPKPDLATRTDRSIVLSPSSVSVVTGDEVRRSGIRYITDVLRLVPGLEIQRVSSTESNVNARGYNDTSSAAQGMLALVDGRQAYNEFFGNAFWDSLPVNIEGLDRIDVIRGPGSSLYGPNAMHGVVNFVTKSPLQYPEKGYVSFSTSAGSYESVTSNLVYVTRDTEKHSGIKFSASWDDIRQFEPRGDNARDKVFGEIRYEKDFSGGDENKEHRLEVTGGVSQQKFDVLIATVQLSPGAAIPTTSFESDADEAFLKANYTVDGFRAQVSWTGFDTDAVPEAFDAPFTLDLDTIDVDLQYTFELQKGHSVTTGSGYRYSKFETSDPDVANGDHHTNLGWVFVQDEVELTDEVLITAGVRSDWHSEAGQVTSPRFALVWGFDRWETDRGEEPGDFRQALRASVGYGFRNPSLRELWFNLPVTVPGLPPITVEGNTSLDPEKIRSFEVSYYGWPVRKLRGSVNAYYNLIDDLVVFGGVLSGGSIQGTPMNQDDEEAYGFEIHGEYFWVEESDDARDPKDPVYSVFGNYAYGVRRNRDTDTLVRFGPRNKANLGFRLTSDRLKAALWATFFDKTFVDSAPFSEVKEYLMVNGNVTYRMFGDQDSRSTGSVFVNAFNLLDNDHKEHPSGDRYGLILTAGFKVMF